MLYWKWYYQDVEIDIGFFLDRTTGREDILLLAKLPMSSRLIGHESGIVEFKVGNIKIHIIKICYFLYLSVDCFLSIKRIFF